MTFTFKEICKTLKTVQLFSLILFCWGKICLFVILKYIYQQAEFPPEVKVKVSQLCPTLWDLMDSTVHGILQARILEWVAFPFSRGSSQARDQTQVSHTAGGFFTI